MSASPKFSSLCLLRVADITPMTSDHDEPGTRQHLSVQDAITAIEATNEESGVASKYDYSDILCMSSLYCSSTPSPWCSQGVCLRSFTLTVRILLKCEFTKCMSNNKIFYINFRYQKLI